MLDAYAAAGGGVVDAAVNYPINKSPSDFGKAASILSDWLRSRRPENIAVLYKIGSRNNLGGPESALTASDILLSAELARGKFAHWLWGLSIHWDNREDLEAIAASLEAFSELSTQGLEIGFSGVKRPDYYLEVAPELADKWWIQAKENLSTNSARGHYIQYFASAKYIAYGINMGGVKGKLRAENSSLTLRGLEVPQIVSRLLEFIDSPPAELKDPPSDMNQLAMMAIWANAALAGVILGPRNLSQLQSSLQYWRRLESRDDLEEVNGLIISLRQEK